MSSWNYWTKLQDQEDTITGSIKNSLMQLLAMDATIRIVHEDDFTKQSMKLYHYLTNLGNGILANIMQNNKTTFPFSPKVKLGEFSWTATLSKNEWEVSDFEVALDYA